MGGRSCWLTSCLGSATLSWLRAACCCQLSRHPTQITTPLARATFQVHPTNWKATAGAPRRQHLWCWTISCSWQPRYEKKWKKWNLTGLMPKVLKVHVLVSMETTFLVQRWKMPGTLWSAVTSGATIWEPRCSFSSACAVWAVTPPSYHT